MEDKEMITGFIVNINDVAFSESVSESISLAVDEDAKKHSSTKWNPDKKSITWSVSIDENSETAKVLREILESLNNIYEWVQYKRYVIFFRIR